MNKTYRVYYNYTTENGQKERVLLGYYGGINSFFARARASADQKLPINKLSAEEVIDPRNQY